MIKRRAASNNGTIKKSIFKQSSKNRRHSFLHRILGLYICPEKGARTRGCSNNRASRLESKKPYTFERFKFSLGWFQWSTAVPFLDCVKNIGFFGLWLPSFPFGGTLVKGLRQGQMGQSVPKFCSLGLQMIPQNKCVKKHQKRNN